MTNHQVVTNFILEETDAGRMVGPPPIPATRPGPLQSNRPGVKSEGHWKMADDCRPLLPTGKECE